MAVVAVMVLVVAMAAVIVMVDYFDLNTTRTIRNTVHMHSRKMRTRSDRDRHTQHITNSYRDHNAMNLNRKTHNPNRRGCCRHGRRSTCMMVVYRNSQQQNIKL